MGITNRKRPGSSGGSSGGKNPPYLSHEFIIQNHGDIATCASMIFIVGLMFQSTTPLASTFIVPKHNITTEPDKPQLPILYTYGLKDLCMVFFYTIVAIIFHAIIQEYILDKWTRRVHLSKTKSSKFNESGQLLAFYMVSTVWAGYIFQSEGYFQSLNFFWTGYPHIGLTLLTKLFFILQLSYWLHILPELYLQKVKKEEITDKVLFAGANFALTAFFYIFNFTRIGLTLIFIDHVINLVFHLSRLLYFSGKSKISHVSFTVYNFLFVGARLAATALSILVFWFSLKSSPSSVEQIKFDEGNFNTQLVRSVSLAALLLIQAFMFWNFILFQLRRIRENTTTTSSSVKSAVNASSKSVSSPKKKRVTENEDGEASGSDNAHNLRSKKEK